MTDSVDPCKKWALYVFFGANVPEAEVREGAVQNLLQMATVGSSKDVAVAAQIHLPGPWAYRYAMPERPPGSNPGAIAPAETIPNCNSADPQTIIEFFKWAANHYPAKQTMLVVWGHGYGLDDYLPRGAGPNVPQPGSPCGRPQLAREDNAESTNLAIQTVNARYIDAALVNVVLDECDHDVLPNKQLGCAAKGCKDVLSGGRQLAILALDACTMAMIEVWSELQGSAGIGIGSEAQEPDASFPYDRILARLNLQPCAPPADVAKMVVDAYVESYAYLNETFVTLSACDLSGPNGDPDDSALGHLLEKVKTLADLLKKAAADPVKRAAIFRARNACPIFDPDGFIDLGRFCQLLEILLPSKEVQAACKDVLDALTTKNGKSGFVEYARYSPLDPTLRVSQTTGLSVWFPPWLEDLSVDIPEQEASIAYLINGYGLTNFAYKTKWGDFLRSMWRVTHCGMPCP